MDIKDLSEEDMNNGFNHIKSMVKLCEKELMMKYPDLDVRDLFDRMEIIRYKDSLENGREHDETEKGVIMWFNVVTLYAFNNFMKNNSKFLDQNYELLMSGTVDSLSDSFKKVYKKVVTNNLLEKEEYEKLHELKLKDENKNDNE